MAWREAWAARNGCVKESKKKSGKRNGHGELRATHVRRPYESTTEYEWVCPQGDVVGYTVDGLGHDWVTQQFPATMDVFLPFFQEHGLR